MEGERETRMERRGRDSDGGARERLGWTARAGVRHSYVRPGAAPCTSTSRARAARAARPGPARLVLAVRRSGYNNPTPALKRHLASCHPSNATLPKDAARCAQPRTPNERHRPAARPAA